MGKKRGGSQRGRRMRRRENNIDDTGLEYKIEQVSI
jgi:hypothetical protein